tara:strand:+ start:122 stop:283 length:162 start_codon:yes stop_codon:yes gene_type:complete
MEIPRASSTITYGQPIKHKINWREIIKGQAKSNYTPGVSATVLNFDPMPHKEV